MEEELRTRVFGLLDDSVGEVGGVPAREVRRRGRGQVGTGCRGLQTRESSLLDPGVGLFCLNPFRSHFTSFLRKSVVSMSRTFCFSPALLDSRSELVSTRRGQESHVCDLRNSRVWVFGCRVQEEVSVWFECR